MNSCVNTKSAAFQQIAKDYDVSVNQLELLAHEYNMIQAEKTGAEDASAFLADEGKQWIKQQLEGAAVEVGPEVLKLWEEQYSKPQIFTNRAKAGEAFSTAQGFFKEGAVLKETSDGKYELTVAHPFNAEYEKRLQDILDNATRDEQGNLLAPNGKVSNLTPRQYAQVRTKEFKDWFGDWENDPENASKVVDENGEPMVVYHGSKAKITSFDFSKNAKGTWSYNGEVIPYDSSLAFFFSTNKGTARTYSLKGMTGAELSDLRLSTAENYRKVKKAITRGLKNLSFSDAEYNLLKYALNNYPLYKSYKPFREKIREYNKEHSTDYSDLKFSEGEIKIKNYTTDKYESVPEDFTQYVEAFIISILEEEEKQFGDSAVLDKDVYECFLNIRNPFAFDYEGVGFGEKYKNKYPIPYINARQVQKALKEGNDGVIYKNISDPYLGDSYGVFNPNQIKSAEGNNGEFSAISNSIYEHRSNVQQALGIVDRAEKALLAAKTDQEIKAIEARFSSYLAEVLSPEIKVAGGNFGLRNGGNTTNLNLLRDVAELEKPATPEELNTLFTTLSRKFAALDGTPKRFRITYGNGLHIVDRGNYYEVQVNSNQLPSYTQLAEEMLHPLVENIQRGNPELFNNFLKEVQTTKDRKLKVIRDGIYKAYSDKSISEQNNELVTQALAYEMKKADQSKLSKAAKAIINAIVKWLVDHNIFKTAPSGMKIKHLAYALKFENVKVNLANMLRTYEHISDVRIPISQSNIGIIEERPVLLDEYQRPVVNSNELNAFLNEGIDKMVKIMSSVLKENTDNREKKVRETIIVPYSEWKNLLKLNGLENTADDAGHVLLDELIDDYVDLWIYESTKEKYKYFSYDKSKNEYKLPKVFYELLKEASKYPALNAFIKKEVNNNKELVQKLLYTDFIHPSTYTTIGLLLLTDEGDVENSSTGFYSNILKILNNAGLQWAYYDKNQLSLFDSNVQQKVEVLVKQQTANNSALRNSLQQEVAEDKIVEDTASAETIVNETNERAEKVHKFLADQQRFYNEIKAIQDSGRLSNKEVREVAADVAYAVSDLITQVQNGEVDINELVPGKTTDKPISEMSRAEILSFIGVYTPATETAEDTGAFSYVRRKYFGNLSNIKGEGKQWVANRKAAVTINQNFRAIVELAAEEFVNVEGFGLRVVDGQPIEVVEGMNINVDDFNMYEDANEVLEREGDLQEHWQVNFRTVDVLGSMSQIVRQALLQCYKLDRDGNPLESRFGIKARVSAREATSQILRWTQGAIDMQSMIKKLQEHSTSNPWINQIISRLDRGTKSDAEYGADTDFRSQFYNVFCKHFQLYTSIIEDANGKFYSAPSNEHPALRDFLTQQQAAIAMDQVPMFQGGRISEEVLAIFKGYVDALPSKNATQFEEMTAEEVEDVQDILWAAMKELGALITADQISDNWTYDNYKAIQSALIHIAKTLSDHVKDEVYDPFEFKGGIKGNLTIAIGALITNLEDVAVSSFYDNGKTYQSYVTPSYLTKFMQKMRLQGAEFDTFIENEFGQYDWFKMDDEWRNPWLKAIVELGDKGYKCGNIPYRELLAHKVELNFDKHGYMREMTPAEYSLSLIAEYFSAAQGTGKESVLPAWYRVPMLSNKPSSEFIRFRRYADQATYKENVVNDLMMVFAQELSRIKTTKARNERYKKGSLEYIKNLDKNGSKFNFLPYLNDTSNSRFNSLIEQKTDPHGEVLTIEEEAELNTLAREEITKYLSHRADEIISKWANNGVMESAVKISGIDKNNVRNQLENFIWNDHLATIMIEELFVTDIALYKNTEDLQKRMAQIHAPGVRGDVTAVDYDGKRVSDGTYRTVLLKDFDTFKSNVIDNIREVFERKEKGLKGAELAAAKALHESIISQYDGINVADAQGYSCFTSRRKKDFIMGLWSREKEAAYKAYKRITEGNYTNDDLASIFNLTKISDACEPEKPFCYSQIKKSTNVPEGMSNYKLGVQYKNSEYLLIMADAILQHEQTSRANLLRAINTFMEESASRNDGKGIDTVQFESTAKALNQGAIDISKYQYEVGGEAAALLELQKAAYTDETMSAYNLSVVHEVPFEDWCIQQPVPNHFYDHAQAQGSQGRMIIPSDLATMYNGEEVKFQVYDKEYTSQEFRKEYETNIAENIKKSIEELQNELGLEGKNRRERNVAIAEILQREIKSSSRYGTDLLRACTLDENGEFIIPLSDPIQSKRIEQLLNSIIKNRVNKQEIAGGPVVQVSNFGTSQDLNIRFKDKRGGLLMTKAEFAKEAKANHLTDAAVEKAYKDYVTENQGGIAYYEIFAPRFDGIELYEDKFGNVDIARIEKECPELLDIIAYRIPTEDKYSMAPCKIVGFLPKYAGAGIMMPADITTITGSDFDVDKMYCMRKEFVRQKGTKGERLFFPHDDTTIGRNNKTVEMYKAVLTHESNADKILNPGGFEPQKRVGYMVQAYKNNPNMTWEELTAIANGKTIEVNGEKLKGTDALKALSYKSSDLGFVDTQIQFYEQNSAASSILAIFAVAKVAHATLEGNKFRVMLNNVGPDGVGMRYPITIGDFTLGTKGDMTAEIDPTFNIKNEYINKALGSLVASAADAVKDPVLNLMNINKETVNVLNTLVRLGMTFEQAALFLSQKTISDLMQEYYKTRLSEGTTLQKVLSDRLSKFKEMGDADEVVLTEEDLVKGLRDSGEALKVYQTLFAFDKVMRIHNALQGMNFVTRYNSISNAVGPLIIDNIMKENKGKVTSFTQILKTLDNGAYSNNEVLGELYAKHPILFQFQRTLGVAQQLFADMPEYNNLFAQALNVKHDIGFDRTILKNRDVLNKYADFFKSYMLIASGVIDKGELNYYVNDFAKEFLKIKQSEKYLNNQFVQAVRVAKDKSGSLYLRVDSGVLNDQTLKGDLSASWADLLTLDKDLAIKLFKYCFFRGGIGFTPRTFMQLVPLELKQAIDGYVGTYRSATISNFPLEDFARMFAQNNWRDYRIVPERKLTDPNPKIGNKFIPHDNGIIEMLASQSNSPYMKWKDEENVYHLYELLPMSDESTSYYQEIPILGGNGEYLEFGIGRNYQPIQKVATTTDNNTTITENETPTDTNELLGGEDVARLDIETADFVSEFSHNEEQATEAKIVEGLDKLGITPTFKNTLGQAVYDAVHEKTPDVTKEAIDKTIDEKNIC